MKILIHDYAGHAFQIQLTRELARRGFEVVHAYAGGLLTPQGDMQRVDGDPPGLSFREVPMDKRYRKNKYKFLKRRGYEVAYGKELQRVIEDERPSIIFSGNTPSEPQLMAVKLANELGIPFVSWVQDFYSVAVKKLAARKSRILGRLAAIYYTEVDRRCFKRSARTVAISEDFIPTLAEYGVDARDISVIENWGAIAEIPMLGKDVSWAREYGFHDKKVFLYTGTMAMKHNPDLVLRLAQRFHNDPEVRVVVVSEGPGADYLMEQKPIRGLSNLVILPFQSFDVLPQVFGAADVMIALLEEDAGVFSVPSKILNYLCSGKPTLAAIPKENLAGRILEKNRAGIVVSPRDAEGFAQAGEDLIDNEALRLEMGACARRYAEENFKVEIVGDKFQRVINQVLGTEKTSPARQMLAANALREEARSFSE
ncbi:glycosyltransferase family 4 protein [Pelagicoccus sp. SDUM812003]|uniref:glycosyltransferase family 4 protein n=1 Tax=Pelagicoccus sp. SDUM812003 TaxID=3041267 RepID=UPI00280ED53D|nr:glycosyltransferase family 4 protein [Pelagicoccus sp. SDUM812003]MDQ8203597.1 glycosyltransferase family 4 protein [Pelagicoccus sp. SDUM812003]